MKESIKSDELFSADSSAILFDAFGYHAGPSNEENEAITTRIFLTFIDCGISSEDVFSRLKYTDKRKYPRLNISTVLLNSKK